MENENEREHRLEQIEITLKDIHRILKPTRWEMFVQGLWRAVGYLFGLILAIAIVGWLLNVIGLIPFMTDFSNTMKGILDVAKTK